MRVPTPESFVIKYIVGTRHGESFFDKVKVDFMSFIISPFQKMSRKYISFIIWHDTNYLNFSAVGGTANGRDG